MMRVSIVGMFKNMLSDLDAYEQGCAKARAEDDVYHLPDLERWPREVLTADGHRYMFEECLLKHLTQLRDRTMAGDYTALDEFFGLYIFQDDIEYKREEPHA